MTNLDHLFTFPIVMVDGDNEEKKNEMNQKLGIDSIEEEVEIIIGEASMPYYDFHSVTDRWMPTDESLNNALNKKFDACGVIFSNAGTYIVPWTKEKFKKEFSKFLAKQEKKDISVLSVSKEEAQKLLEELTRNA